MSNFTSHPDYDKLPEAIKMEISDEEFAWMNDERRAHIVDEFCCPEPEED